jgi:putative transposase
VKANQATYPVRVMCRVLKVSPSGFYSWRKRAPSRRAQQDAQLRPLIHTIHRRSRCSYGSPRIRDELADEHRCRVGRKRVARLMRQQGLRGVMRSKYVVTTCSDALATPVADQVQRRFAACTANRLWVADFTYVPTAMGVLYLAIVMDVYCRRIVGWSMREDMSTALVSDALQMALLQRRPTAVIHHSDHGSQYTSQAFAALCERAGVSLSMGSLGDAYDNAMAESFFATIKTELIHQYRFQSYAEARAAIFEYIEGWYNPHRRHSALGHLSPINYERRMAAA